MIKNQKNLVPSTSSSITIKNDLRCELYGTSSASLGPTVFKYTIMFLEATYLCFLSDGYWTYFSVEQLCLVSILIVNEREEVCAKFGIVYLFSKSNR